MIRELCFVFLIVCSFFLSAVGIASATSNESLIFFDDYEDEDFTNNPTWKWCYGDGPATIENINGNHWMKLFRVSDDKDIPTYETEVSGLLSQNFELSYQFKLSSGDYTGCGLGLTNSDYSSSYNIALNTGPYWADDWKSGFQHLENDDSGCLCLLRTDSQHFEIDPISRNESHTVKLVFLKSEHKWTLYIDGDNKGSLIAQSENDSDISKIVIQGKSASSPGNGCWIDNIKITTEINETNSPSRKALFVTYESADIESYSLYNRLINEGFNITRSVSIPEDMNEYDLVIVQSYDACWQTTANYMKEYIANGGGAVLVSGVPSNFPKEYQEIGSSFGYYDISYISEWFGTARYENVGVSDATITMDNPFGTTLISGDYLAHCSGWGGAAVSNLNQDTTMNLAMWDYSSDRIFAFTNNYGAGRMFYTAALNSSEKLNELELAGALWASRQNNQSSTADAELISVDYDLVTVPNGGEAKVSVQVRNTGNVENTFYIGYSVWDSLDTLYDIDSKDVTLSSGESKTVVLTWDVPWLTEDHLGSFDSKVAVWSDKLPNGELSDQLDSQTESNAFEVIMDYQYLAMEYLPSLRYSQGDEYHITTVEHFLKESSLKGTVLPFEPLLVGWILIEDNMDDAAFSPYVGPLSSMYQFYKLDLKNDASEYEGKSIPAVYVNIKDFSVDIDEIGKTDFIGIQYWWLSYYNSHEVWLDHEGDWEHITVYVNKNTGNLEYASYGQHYDGKCFTPDQIASIGNHPSVFVARGSHASYSNYGLHIYKDLYLEGDIIYHDYHFGDGRTFHYKDFEENVYFFSDLMNAHKWPYFNGRWGDTDPWSISFINFDGSPKTPSVQEKFNPKLELTSQRREVHSPAYLCAIDEYGRRVGYNATTGEIDMQIPGAYYSGPDEHPQVLSVDDLNLNVKFYMIPKDDGGECDIVSSVNNFQEKQSIYFKNVTIGENTTAFSNTSDISTLNLDINDDGVIDQIIEAPSVSFTVDRTKIITGESILFDAKVDSKSDNQTYVWDFGDNTTADIEDVVHTYEVSGIFYPSLTVRTNDGASASYSTCVEVESLDPQSITPWSDFSTDKVSGVQPLTVQFYDQSLDATSLEWDFGDGSPLSFEQNPVHIYNEEGKYAVSLNASSSEGYNIETKVDYIIVYDWNPWNDLGSDGGEAITLVELQDAIYCWRFGIDTSTGELVDLVRLQDLIYSWRFGY
ncbi:PKD domain-containing protein [Methanolobus mangrovi]|uniref:PKD domain-containing protein n=1 Tax=Methanolobus mangrovi TaxID=3072977 RepID=A0AA51UJX6_9EURY|nr:PKD domain-containing protein [Methanolobus mangrovi]WMW23066.1 PKD domain-containing protein [Methanolobus mangrovi]